MAVRTIALAAAAIALALPATAATLTETWRATGFDTPESVSYDPGTNSLYVSNINGGTNDKDGNGYISKLDANGTVTDRMWVTGLNGPKGTAIVGNTLYVTDIDELVEIDIPSAKVTHHYPAEGAMFLNDPAVAPDGRVFVADTFANRIYVLDGGKMSTWFEDPKLVGPNGLVVMDGKLIVAELGDASKGFDKLVPGNVKAIDLATKALSDFGPSGQIGGLDGIEDDGKGGVTVTDNGGGRLLMFMPGHPEMLISKIEPGSADHEWVPSMNEFVIPNLQSGDVVAYKLSE